MKFFIDGADVNEIRELAATGMVDGVTTNPTLVAKTGRPIRDVIADICAIVPGPVSAEVTATDYDGMLKQAATLSAIAKNVTIKVPLTWDGLRACRALTGEGKMVNVTLCFDSNQALLAAKAGATFISPFVGRLDDIGYEGMDLVREIRQVYDNYPHFKTEILAASMRSPLHVKAASMAGADVATMPAALIKSLTKHPLTESGLATFLADWKKTGMSID
ncbi:MAG: fructose-6-phosphate aldolase [Bauldia sp.]